ncbi:MAG: transporter [Lachnospiraceae bacterium]|nr:transporter [Lachnospiraceae bacterium]
MGFLLLNPSEAVAGSRAGLMLWFQSVLPVLLPFFILSRLLISINGIAPLTRLLSPLTRHIWGLSPMGTYALLLGFLCGYPMGAKIAGDLVREGKITPAEGNYLLLFCNNVSPAFLMGFCLTEQLKAPALLSITLGLVYGLPLLLAVFWRKNFHNFTETNSISHKFSQTQGQRNILSQKQASGSQISFKIVDTCIMDGLESILKLGCYIILFSIMARLATQIPWPNLLIGAISVGILEITNGIALVCQLPLSFPIRYLTVLGFVILGGGSGLAQTQGMLVGSGLLVSRYIKAKLITAVTALLLAAILFTVLPSLMLPR